MSFYNYVPTNVHVAANKLQWEESSQTFKGVSKVINDWIDWSRVDNVVVTNPATHRSATFQRSTPSYFRAEINGKKLYLKLI